MRTTFIAALLILALNASAAHAAAPEPTATTTATPEPAATPSPAPEFAQTAEVMMMMRLSGSERIGTAIAISDHLYNEHPRAFIVLAASHDFPDALSGGSLAARMGAPLLLTPTHTLHPDTLAAINRYAQPNHADTTVVLMGGVAALSAEVERAVEAEGYRIHRVNGTNRFHTAALATKVGNDRVEEFFVADGGAFQDAVIASNAAGDSGGLLLTSGSTMSNETAALLSNDGRPATAIGAAAATAAPNLDAIYGVDYFDTSVRVAQQLFPNYRAFALARADEFADALAGTAHSGAFTLPPQLPGIPLFLVNRDSTPDIVVEEIGGSTQLSGGRVGFGALRSGEFAS